MSVNGADLSVWIMGVNKVPLFIPQNPQEFKARTPLVGLLDRIPTDSDIDIGDGVTQMGRKGQKDLTRVYGRGC
jgi:hypothetical protein